MDYLVLARKCRPQSFADVVGQEHVARTLKNAILQNRIAHAFIFSGPRGVGKTSVARILAKALNCEKGPTPEPCQECANCREITAGHSMDVREIDGASNRGIEEIRELRENVKYSPASSRYKIYIIDEVHMLTVPAFNALLKTLEEPPSHVIFVLATTELNKIPATILSRCQGHDFRMIPLKPISENLRKIAEAENIRISSVGLAWIAAAGGGSLRDAQSIFDQVISYAGSEIKDTDVEELLCLADRRFLFMLSGAVLKRNAGQCLEIIKEAYYAGLDMKYFYQLLLNHFRNLFFIKIAGKDPSLFDLADDDLAKLQVQGEGVARETMQKHLDILLAEEEGMRRTQDPRLLLETTIVRMAGLEELIPIDEILGRMENLEKKLRAGMSGNYDASAGVRGKPSLPDAIAPQAVPETAGLAPAARECQGVYKADGDNPEQLWEDYKAYAKKHSPPLWSKIEKGRLLGFQERVLTIGFPAGYLFLDDIRNKTQKERLAEISRGFFGDDVEVRIEIIKSDNGDPAGNTTPTQKHGRDFRQEALNHPLLQKVFDVFEGAELREIVPKI
jgi:DNA polymerase-3 subunit gamma/tau